MTSDKKKASTGGVFIEISSRYNDVPLGDANADRESNFVWNGSVRTK